MYYELTSTGLSSCICDARKRLGKSTHIHVDWYAFPQMWGSTALGFGGIGGCVMTTAQTVVVGYGNRFIVYFGGRFAYDIEGINSTFIEDMKMYRMKSVKDCIEYIKKD